MRKQFVSTISEIIAQDERLVLLLGDIGVYGFKELFSNFPDRVYNIGILEQSTISLGAGLSTQGLIPVIHTIAPFIVERAYEQIKNDFCYQSQGGNFVSVGASYDYPSSGPTHHCPGDMGVLNMLPGMQTLIPGTANEFDSLFKQCYDNGSPTYYRLSSDHNQDDNEVELHKAKIVKQGSKGTIVAFGPVLDMALEAAKDMDVTVLYYTTVKPFDYNTMSDNYSEKIYVIEPFYTGTTYKDIIKSCRGKPVIIEGIGVPNKFLHHYGTKKEHDRALGFETLNIKNKIDNFLNQ